MAEPTLTERLRRQPEKLSPERAKLEREAADRIEADAALIVELRAQLARLRGMPSENAAAESGPLGIKENER